MTHNAEESEDLTQEVFIHLLDKAGSFRGESQFSTWLYRLTVNFVLMHLRRKNPRLRQLSEEFESWHAGLHSKPARMTFQLADRIALESALKKLPLGCRSVFVLYDIAGYKHEEIAKVLGCSVGTSKSQLYRARMKLRKIMSARVARARTPPRPLQLGYLRSPALSRT
jgi:RNA polymerase sigma-70 factor (ECF subfamily)